MWRQRGQWRGPWRAERVPVPVWVQVLAGWLRRVARARRPLALHPVLLAELALLAAWRVLAPVLGLSLRAQGHLQRP